MPSSPAARGPPAVAGLGRRAIGVSRRAGGAREEARRAGRVDAGQLDLAAEIVPADAQPLGRAEQGRAMVDLAALVAQVEADRIAVAGDQETGGAAIAVELGVAERAGERAVGGAEDAEIEGEAVVERGDGAAPEIGADAAERDRRREGLARAARIAPVRGRARGLQPEAIGSRRRAAGRESRRGCRTSRESRPRSPWPDTSRSPIAARQPRPDRRIVSGPRGAGPKSA